MTDYRALCAELVEQLQRAINDHGLCLEGKDALMFRARTALSQSEPGVVGLPQIGTVESADAMEQIATETGLEWTSDAGMYLCSVGRGSTMTTPPLSPAAQAVMDAVNNAPLYQDIAAALIAAADQVVPEEFTHRSPCREHCIIGGAAERIRAEFLALATELRQEGQP